MNATTARGLRSHRWLWLAGLVCWMASGAPGAERWNRQEARETQNAQTGREDVPGQPALYGRESRTPANACERSSSTIVVEKCGPTEVQAGHEFTYTLKVSNPSDQTLYDVRLTEQVPAGFELRRTSPEPSARAGSSMTWELGALRPRDSRAVTLSGVAAAPGEIVNKAFATHSTPVEHRLQVFQPKLRLVKSGPAEALLCDPIPFEFIVTNEGTGTARNVVVRDQLPEGMTTRDGQATATLHVGDLRAGESKKVSLETKASRTGRYNNTAAATADGNLSAEAAFTTVVRQPVLAIEKSGPNTAYLNRPARYTITLTNKGDGVASETRLVDVLPDQCRLKAASQGAKWFQKQGPERELGGEVRWELGDLAAGESRQLTVVIVPTQIGRIVNTATATARCAQPVTDSTETLVEGISAILLEVVDIHDPVPVGEQTTYVITATNQGSSMGTNIRIVCDLEDNMQHISSTGATTGTAQNGQILFAPLPRLDAHKKAEWRVTVKAIKPGDVRFKVQMTSDQLTRPVLETEATNLYE